ncbi:DSD1 family PLP-dependent enzyme [Amorphus sp. 3PC139-8]|uniref:DSD1 family PLP-dependent enzyme n=1 Tax=Amorphus sp. 3PC139-8 TaxID=2735676 RepID=UPI00345C7753
MQQPPAKVGDAIETIDTPALLIDLPRFEANLVRMAAFAAKAGVALRPHAKTHKSAAIAHRQVEAGAVGVCCQKVSEAEAMVRGGIADVFVSNEIVGPAKLARLASLATQATISVAVDHPANVQALSEAAARAGAQIDVLVELDVGAHRCGVRSAQAAADLAGIVDAAGHLRLMGLHAYFGSAQHIEDWSARQTAITGAVRLVEETLRALTAAGLKADVVTGAGTGSFPFEAASHVYTELQVGSYIFMDASYRRIRDEGGRPTTVFDPSLFVRSTVMSTPEPGLAIIDAGLKALSPDSGPPELVEPAGASYLGASDEHGRVAIPPGMEVALGDCLTLIPGHCDPTINLHDWYVGIREGRVETVWPVDARGAIF